MAIAPATPFSNEYWNFLTENFETYDPARPESVLSFGNLPHARVILLGEPLNNPIAQRAFTQFLKSYTGARVCILADGLSISSSANPSQLDRFKTLPSHWAIHGVSKKSANSPSFVTRMNLIYSYQEAFLTYYEAEKERYKALSAYLKDRINDGSMALKESGLETEPRVLEIFSRLWNDTTSRQALAAKDLELREYLENEAERNTTPLDLVASGRWLLKAIQKHLKTYERVFVLSSEFQFICNDEFYSGLASLSQPSITLLAHSAADSRFEKMNYPATLLEDKSYILITQKNSNPFGANSRRFYIPTIFKHWLEEAIQGLKIFNSSQERVTLLNAEHFKRAANSGTLAINRGTRILIPIVRYRAASEYIRTHYYQVARSEINQAYFTIFDDFLFLSGVGVRLLTGSTIENEFLLLRDKKWYLTINTTASIRITITTTTAWINSIYLLETLAQRNVVYPVAKDCDLRITDLNAEDIESVVDDPDILPEILSNYAPPHKSVRISGSYICRGTEELIIQTKTGYSIHLVDAVENVGHKRDIDTAEARRPKCFKAMTDAEQEAHLCEQLAKTTI